MSKPPERLTDRCSPHPVTSSGVAFRGRVWDVARDEVDLGTQGRYVREYVRHPGAVAVLALDERDRVCLIQQYRHPIGTWDWELPAGMLDIEDEAPWQSAARELHEEVDLRAEHWDTLLDVYTSPGGSSEQIRIYLARGLTEVPENERHTRVAEEHGMPRAWASLTEVAEAALFGRVRNATLIAGIFAASAARELRWRSLRPADATWAAGSAIPGGRGRR